jgi:4-hydroxybenzoate polyprenyltransferase
MQTEIPATNTAASRLGAYLQLCRAPNVFTAVADVSMGVIFVRERIDPAGSWLALTLASALLYSAGMVLNDVYDVDVDARERPERPLPSGRIALARARRLGYGLLAGGVLSAALGGLLAGPPNWMAGRCGLVAVSLVVCIWLYDALLKQTLIGPFIMGACRCLNVLLGMSIACPGLSPAHVLAFGDDQLLVSVAIGCYVVGVTWFARGEATHSRRALLMLGFAFMAGGLCLLALLPRWFAVDSQYRHVWPFALLVLMIPTLRRCLIAVLYPRPRNVQAAVRQCLFSLIVLDASICLLVAPWPWAVAVLALLVPTFLLGQWIPST